MAGRRRAPGGRDVLHVGHDRAAEGRRLLAPLDGPALARRGAAGRQVGLPTRHAAAGRADVPRQRLGDDLHRGADRLGAGAARAQARRGQRARPARRRAGDDHRRRADRLDGGPGGARGRARPLGPERARPPDRRRLGGAAVDDGALRPPRADDRPRLGDDRDLAAGQRLAAARRARRRAGGRALPLPRAAGHRFAVRRDPGPQRRRRAGRLGRRADGRAGGSRAVGRARPTTAVRGPRSSPTTAGSSPATSSRSTPAGT